MRQARIWPSLVVVCLLGCTGDPAAEDAGATSSSDAGSDAGSGLSDAGLSDATGGDANNTADAPDGSGVDAPDTSSVDAGTTTDGAGDTDAGATDTGPTDTGATDTGPTPPTATLPPATTYTKDPHINRVSKLAILSEKEGCDLNDDAAPDNIFGKVIGIYAAANDALQATIDDGGLVLLLRPTAWHTDKTPFAIEWLRGALSPTNASCKPGGAAPCSYVVDPTSFDASASGPGPSPPKVLLSPATVDGSQLIAGSKQQIIDLELNVVGIKLKLPVRLATVSGVVSGATAWTSTSKGVLCGVIGQKDLNAALGQQPGFPNGGRGGVLKPDIDTDGDKIPDAISIALSLETQAAKVTGYK